MEKIKKWWMKRPLKKYFESFWGSICTSFSFKEGGKKRINLEKLVITGSFLTGPLLVVYFFISGENSSYIGRTSNTLMEAKRSSDSNHSSKQTANSYSYPVQRNANHESTNTSAQKPTGENRNPLKLVAKQVLIRDDAGLGYGFHVGSNLIGELQSTIDTRDPNQFVRVILPYGGKSRDGNSELPRGTLLMGKISYQGKSDKVFVQFHQAILPEGKSIKIAATALDPKDYSTGLTGEIQRETSSRTLSALGLSAISAMGAILTEKETMGQYHVEAKASLKNAMLAGASKVAEVEASRLQEQSGAQDYVQVDAGTAVVVSLTQGLQL